LTQRENGKNYFEKFFNLVNTTELFDNYGITLHIQSSGDGGRKPQVCFFVDLNINGLNQRLNFSNKFLISPFRLNPINPFPSAETSKFRTSLD